MCLVSPHRSKILFITTLLLLLVSTIYADKGQNDNKYVPGELIIQVSGKRVISDVQQSFSQYKLTTVKQLSKRMNIWLFSYDNSGMKTSDNDAFLENIRSHSKVTLAQFNHYITERQTFPNDPSFSSQWDMHNTGQTGGLSDADIDGPEAWDITTGGFTVTGDEIVTAVIDGGFDINHVDINFWKNENEIPGNSIDDDGNGYVDDYDGWNVYGDNGTIPSASHGTHVAGTVGAIGNNGIGVTGVNWNGKVMPIAGSSTVEATVVESYSYVHEMRSLYNQTDGAFGAFIVSTNASFGVDFGDPASYPIWCAIYDSLGEVGILSCGATANLNINIDVEGDVPTACASDFMIAVTNTTDDDVKNSGAAYGATTIDLGAPGTSILSTVPGNGYSTSTGTSMATPHVAGAISLLYSSACVSLINDYKNDPASIALIVKDYILNGTDPIASLDGTTVTGGRLNIYNSILLTQTYACGVSINHTPLTDIRDSLNDYQIIAEITSDTTLDTDSLFLHYDLGSGYVTSLMTSTVNPDEYESSIPAQSPGTVIDYFLTAVDTEGKADTTDIFTFRVVDYGLALNPVYDTQTGAVDDTVLYLMSVSNDGLFADDYSLSLSNNLWNTTLWDVTLTSEISSTGSMNSDDTLDFYIRVIVPVSLYGDSDSVGVTATSTGDGAYSATSGIVTISDGEPFAIPFTDDFPTTTVDVGRWVLNSGGESNDIGLAEPSAPYSLNLNGNPNGADTVMSQAIDLAGESNVIVKYFYEQTGGADSPEAGDDLYSEYLDSTGAWVVLTQHLGSDPDESEYTEVVAQLPGEAMHSGFRLRFRCTGTVGAFDDWFVDDVFVGNPPAYEVSVSPQFSSGFANSGDTVYHTAYILNSGLNDDTYDLSVSGNLWDVSFFDAFDAPITQTSLIPSNDSELVEIRVFIPVSALMADVDSATVTATSQADNLVSGSVVVESNSNGTLSNFPWFEPFPSDTLVSYRWDLMSGAAVSTDGLNEPSEPYSLNLDGSVDTAVTTTLDLSGQTGVILSYYYQAGGGGDVPEAGDDLLVEYKNDIGIWGNLNTHTGGSGIMTGFEYVSIGVPTDGYYNGFQIRFISTGNSANADDWFVDDIRVDFAPTMSYANESMTQTLLAGDTAYSEMTIDNGGPGGLNYSINVIPILSNSEKFIRLLKSNDVEPARRIYPDGFDSDYTDIKGSDDIRQGFDVTRDAGGPDVFGYFWIDSDEPGGPTFDWTDISGSGVDIVADLDDDNAGGPYLLGFDFPYYGTDYSEIYIGSNGIIGFGPDGMNSRFKVSIPTSSTPNNMLCWLWDDLNPDDPDNSSHVYVDTTGGLCVIQFSDYSEYSAAAGDVVNAQVILEPNGRITYQYLSIGAGFDITANTVGIENADGTDGLEVSYLTSYLHDSLAIQFTAPYLWLKSDKSSGDLLTGESDTISFEFTTGDLDTGVYQANIVITSNDPNNNPVVIPAELTVTDVPPYICGDVDNNGSGPDIADLVYFVDYSFGNPSGPAPVIPEAADVNNDNELNIGDIVYMVDYMFGDPSGPAPDCG